MSIAGVEIPIELDPSFEQLVRAVLDGHHLSATESRAGTERWPHGCHVID